MCVRKLAGSRVEIFEWVRVGHPNCLPFPGCGHCLPILNNRSQLRSCYSLKTSNGFPSLYLGELQSPYPALQPLLNFPSVSPTVSCPLALSTLDIFLFLKHASLTFIPTFLRLPSSYNTFSRVSLGWFLLVIGSTEAQRWYLASSA